MFTGHDNDMNIGMFREVLMLFSKNAITLVIDLSLFMNFNGIKNINEIEYYQALKEFEFPLLQGIELTNLTFCGNYDHFEFAKNATEINIRGNFGLQIDEFNL
jgi:hypothetical protein